MKGGRWTQKLELRLVTLYKKFPCLWMISSPAYNDLDRRYGAYVKIVETLKPEFRGLTVPKVVYKIRDLRYRYCVELTKIERATACGEYYTPNVSWFQVMHSFLDLRFRTDENKDSNPAFNSEEKFRHDYSGTRLTLSTCKTIYDNHLKMEESKSTVGEFEESGNGAENHPEICDQKRGCREAEKSEDVEEIENHLGDFFEKSTRPFELKVGDKITKTLVSATKKPNSKPRTQNKNHLMDFNEFDEFNAFAMSIASQLKTLDPKLVIKLEVMILIILNDEKTKILQ